MTISTKFNVGDEVYLYYEGKIDKLLIETISINVKPNQYAIDMINIVYNTDKGHFNEVYIFSTKQELLEHLHKTIE